MKTVQKQYKNSTKTVSHLLNVGRGRLKNLWLMAVPLLFLLPSSCNEPQILDAVPLDAETEIRNIIASGCGDDPCDGNYDDIKVINEDYSINGCSVRVHYRMARCGNSFYVTNIGTTLLNPTSPACNKWNQYFQNGQTVQANEALNAFYNAITMAIESTIVSQFSSAFPILTVNVIETYCHTMCVSYDGEGNPNVYHERCGTNCCIRTRQYVNGIPYGAPAYAGNPTCTPISITCNQTGLPCQPACARL